MYFLSYWIKVIFIIVFAFPLYSEASMGSPPRTPPECNIVTIPVFSCGKTEDAICGSDGLTYYNPCVFCNFVKQTNGSLSFKHYGRCDSY